MLDLQKQLREEIKRIEDEIDAKKSLIKKNIGNSLIVETAELEMKALHTRLSVLEANLAKQTAPEQ
jgi:hypothetical protein